MATPLTFNWSNFSGNISGGVSQNTGGINVGITYVNDGNGTTSNVVATAQFVDTAAGETFASNSSLQLGGSGGVGSTSTTTVDFSAVSGSGFSEEVDNVTFRINDFDTSSWIDTVTVRAYDADDNLINVDLTWNGSSFSGTNTTLVSNVANGSALTQTGSILVEIAGPVSRLEIDYDNNGSGGQALWITDIHFDAIDVPDGTVEGTSGDDVIDDAYEGDPERDMVDNNDAILTGDTGDDDLIFGFGGNDIITAGAGNDEIFGGEGSDTFNIGANEGSDIIEGGEDGNGADIDTLSFSDANGPTGVNVTLSDDEDGSYEYPVDGGDGNFSEIENFELTDQEDSFDGALATGGSTVDGGAGSDTLIGGAGADVFEGGDGTDFLSGGEGDDTLYGGEGDDAVILENGFGNDVIEGGETGETTGDILDASLVTQDVTVDLSAVNAADNESGTITNGTDTSTFEEIEIVRLGNGDDTIIGSSGDDFVAGGTGADIFDMGAGNDVIDLGLGLPVFGGPQDGDDDADVVILQDGSGNDTIFSFDAPTDNGDGTFTGTDTLDVSALNGADGIPVNTNDVTVTNDGSGNALLTFPNGESVTLLGISPTNADDPFYLNAIGIPLPDGTVSGTSGNDTIVAGYVDTGDGDTVDDNDAILAGHASNDDLIEAGSGNDFVDGSLGDDTIFGEDGNDTLEGNVGNDTIFGGFGSDTIFGGDGDDVLHEGSTGGAAGTLFGGAGNDTLFTGTGSANDTLFGGTGNDTLTDQGNTSSNDTLAGGDGDDTVTAGFGNDTILVDAANGTDTITGGEDLDGLDIDTLTFTDNAGTEGVDVQLVDNEEGTYSFPTDGGEGSFTQIEAFNLTDQDDTFDGALATNGNSVDAGAGDDVLTGSTGDDDFDGDAGDDTFVIEDNFGDDTIVGGETSETNGDVIDGSALNDDVVVDFSGPETGTITDGTDIATFSEIEEIETGAGNDTVLGDSGNDVVTTNDGEDVVFGGAGNDTFDTGAGDDSLFGGTGSDSLSAGAGDDTITASEGDTVDGGSGNDTIVLEDLGELSNGTITIDGGAGNETGGDTLQIGSLGPLNQAVRDTFVDDGSGSFSGSITLDDGTILNFSEIENIICFTPETRIATANGLVAIKDLKIGDLVVTRDHGLQPVRWLESRAVPAVDRFAPVRIRPNVLAGQDRDLIVSPQHRVLFQGYRAELLFGESEVLVAAKHLIDGMDVTQDEQEMVTYVHMMFDRHEIIYAEGAATESFHPGDIGINATSDAAREELFTIFPELRADQSVYGNTARKCLKAHEAKLIRS